MATHPGYSDNAHPVDALIYQTDLYHSQCLALAEADILGIRAACELAAEATRRKLSGLLVEIARLAQAGGCSMPELREDIKEAEQRFDALLDWGRRWRDGLDLLKQEAPAEAVLWKDKPEAEFTVRLRRGEHDRRCARAWVSVQRVAERRPYVDASVTFPSLPVPTTPTAASTVGEADSDTPAIAPAPGGDQADDAGPNPGPLGWSPLRTIEEWTPLFPWNRNQMSKVLRNQELRNRKGRRPLHDRH